MRDNSNKVINDLYGYLGLEKDFMPDTNQKHNSYSMPKYDWIQKMYSSHAVRTTLSILFPKSIKDFLLRKFFERSKKPKLNFETKNHLLRLYKPDIKKLEELIGVDLSKWYENE